MRRLAWPHDLYHRTLLCEHQLKLGKMTGPQTWNLDQPLTVNVLYRALEDIRALFPGDMGPFYAGKYRLLYSHTRHG